METLVLFNQCLFETTVLRPYFKFQKGSEVDDKIVRGRKPIMVFDQCDDDNSLHRLGTIWPLNILGDNIKIVHAGTEVNVCLSGSKDLSQLDIEDFNDNSIFDSDYNLLGHHYIMYSLDNPNIIFVKAQYGGIGSSFMDTVLIFEGFDMSLIKTKEIDNPIDEVLEDFFSDMDVDLYDLDEDYAEDFIEYIFN